MFCRSQRERVTAHFCTSSREQDKALTAHLNTADDGGGECGVVLRAQHDGVHQKEAVQHNQAELDKGGDVGDTGAMN